ncbi:hypothetical protein EDD99_0922 [Streptomyces sp. 846.5]|nr:hypothetical protein [Streptomyces sp. 846.5]TDU02524.1 hypothetical protein EDD99_0922 [Streptomyces sp. 846.5]
MSRRSCGMKKRLCPGSVFEGVCPIFRPECPNMAGGRAVSEIIATTVTRTVTRTDSPRRDQEKSSEQRRD